MDTHSVIWCRSNAVDDEDNTKKLRKWDKIGYLQTTRKYRNTTSYEESKKKKKKSKENTKHKKEENKVTV
jgi:hypothetical protein